MKLDIGSGECQEEDYVKIDNLDDGQRLKEFVNVIADGNKLPFKDQTFDEVRSIRCVGYYADVHEAVRVLKTGHKIELNVWTEKLGYVLDQLIELEVKIEKLEGLNYDDDEGFYDVWIEGIKTR